ncbi:MAG: SAM-dependent methyltransferase, partial [Candidatus Competibacteraceae bacterium]|nr:SAM-dependent methyltransferase [Candidatus Competibacteraceae bacterium]
MQIFECSPDAQGKIPERAIRQKIDRQLTQTAYEHLIVYVDASRSEQVWQWVARQPGKPVAYRESTYRKSQTGDALVQKLAHIYFTLNDEEAIDLTGVSQRLRDAFDRDKVTKKFYEHFKKQHDAFLGFIEGIDAKTDKEWYASLMLNRLMFIYFIQRKGFLDNDPNYLKTRLSKIQEQRGKDQFLSFYRYFLLCLFHEGFSKQPPNRDLSPDLSALLGDVPYLNGGLFDLHELEQSHQHLDIPDEAFEQLFEFFDQYEWHLDNSTLGNDREINPDVLGYIFEKYINQKQMGAYYTKEDITEYISKNTVIPHLFDTACKDCAIAFASNSTVWTLLQQSPDAYLYPAMRQGVIDQNGKVIPETELPDFVQQGMHDPKARMLNRDYNLSVAVIPDANGNNQALPTETWREYINRRKRCLELREKLAKGEIQSINDLITYNLNIRQFAQDVIQGCEGPELLRAFYKAISSVTVLDPTCGSGAFLFAALNILQPLYEACLERM